MPTLGAARAAARSRGPRARTCRRGSAAARACCRRRRGAGTRTPARSRPPGASESSASSASGSDSPPSRISAIPSRSQIARSVGDALRPGAAPAEQPHDDDPRAGDERLDVVDAGSRARTSGKSGAELAHGVRRGEDLGVGGRQETEQAITGSLSGAPRSMRSSSAGASTCSPNQSASRSRCASRTAANDVVPGVQSRPRRSATHVSSARRNASPSSRPCQLVPRTSPCVEQRLVAVDAAVADLVAARRDVPDRAGHALQQLLGVEARGDREQAEARRRARRRSRRRRRSWCRASGSRRRCRGSGRGARAARGRGRPRAGPAGPRRSPSCRGGRRGRRARRRPPSA